MALRRAAALLGAAAALCACAAAPSTQRIPAHAAPPAPPPAPVPLDPSSDWRGLVSAPFGSSLKQLPFPVHEALVFHEPGASGDDQECYSRVEPPPFVGVTPNDYLLCFRNDRLSRIEVSVTPPATAEADAFEHWCDRWLQGTEAIGRDSTHCEGRGAGLAFRARVEPSEAAPAWSMVVRDATERGGAETEKQ